MADAVCDNERESLNWGLSAHLCFFHCDIHCYLCNPTVWMYVYVFFFYLDALKLCYTCTNQQRPENWASSSSSRWASSRLSGLSGRSASPLCFWSFSGGKWCDWRLNLDGRKQETTVYLTTTAHNEGNTLSSRLGLRDVHVPKHSRFLLVCLL